MIKIGAIFYFRPAFRPSWALPFAPKMCSQLYREKMEEVGAIYSVLLKITLKEAFSVNCALICCTLTKDILVLSGE